LVSLGDGLGSGGSTKSADGPETLTERADIKVNLDLVVLEGNKRKSKSRVAAKPEKKRNVKSGLRKGLARSTHLRRSSRCGTRSRNVGKGRVGDVGKLSGVSNHLVVTLLLLGRKSELVPDVHPVTVLAVNSLSSNLNLNLGNELLTNVVQPTGINTAVRNTGNTTVGHVLVNLRKSDLKVSAVAQITVT